MCGQHTLDKDTKIYKLIISKDSMENSYSQAEEFDRILKQAEARRIGPPVSDYRDYFPEPDFLIPPQRGDYEPSDVESFWDERLLKSKPNPDMERVIQEQMTREDNKD